MHPKSVDLVHVRQLCDVIAHKYEQRMLLILHPTKFWLFSRYWRELLKKNSVLARIRLASNENHDKKG